MILLSSVGWSMRHSDSRQKAEISLGNSCTDRSLSSSKVKKNLKSSSREEGFQSRYKYMKRRWRPSIGSTLESKVWCSECSVNYNNMLGMVVYPDRPVGSKSLGSWRLNLLLAPCFCYSCPSMIFDLHSVLHWVITGPTAGYQVFAQLTWREWEWRWCMETCSRVGMGLRCGL